MTRSGFSLVEVIVSVAILSLLIGFVVSLSEFTHRETATDERLGEGIRAGVFVANSLRDLGFLDLIKKCQSENVFQTAATGLACVDATRSKLTQAVAAPAPGLIPLKVRVNSAGEPDPNGRLCVEMTSCRLIADGHLVAVNVVTSWIGLNQSAQSTVHQIRVLR